jgi:hypothetical protein
MIHNVTIESKKKRRNKFFVAYSYKKNGILISGILILLATYFVTSSDLKFCTSNYYNIFIDLCYYFIICRNSTYKYLYVYKRIIEHA